MRPTAWGPRPSDPSALCCDFHGLGLVGPGALPGAPWCPHSYKKKALDRLEKDRYVLPASYLKISSRKVQPRIHHVGSSGTVWTPMGRWAQRPCPHGAHRPRPFLLRYRGTMAIWHHVSMIPRCHGTMVPWFHASMVLWLHSSKAPWCHGSMVARCCGAMLPWYSHGTMVSWY